MSATPAREALDWVLSISAAPTDEELTSRFSQGFLAAVGLGQLAPLLPTLVDGVRGAQASLEVSEVDAHRLVAVIGDTEILVSVDTEPPHAINGLLFRPVQVRVADERLTAPDVMVSGSGALAEFALATWQREQLVGLSLHVDDRGTASSATVGWADLDGHRTLTAGDLFPAYSITKLLTTVAVLQLVAAGEVDLEGPVAPMLTSLSLPGDITVRHLLTHHGAVSSAFSHWADEVHDLIDVLCQQVAVDGPPGRGYVYSNGGFGVLGQLIADRTGRPYVDVIEQGILRPLGMTSSTFPTRVPPGGVVLHEVGADGTIEAPAQQICTIPSAGGLWSTAADLATFGRGWSTLLPDDLAAAAVAPQATRTGTAMTGLGWALGSWNERRVAGHTGGGIGACSSLLVMPDDGLTAVTLVNRRHPVEQVSFRALEPALAARG